MAEHHRLKRLQEEYARFLKNTAYGSNNDIFGMDRAAEFKRPAGTLELYLHPAINRRATLSHPSGTGPPGQAAAVSFG
jgi:hypothetical protein